MTETKPIILDDDCSFCDVALSLPMNAPDWSMVVGDIEQHHYSVCGRKRSYSESEKGRDEKGRSYSESKEGGDEMS